MDPATWSWLTCAWLIETSVGGILGNRLDAKATDVWAQGWQTFTQKMRGDYSTPINQDLEISVHRAFLLAQQSLVCDCLAEFTGGTWTALGAVQSVVGAGYAVLPEYSEQDVNWLQKQLKQIRADLKKLHKGDYSAISREALDTSTVLLMTDQEWVAAETESVLRDELATNVLTGGVPESYKERATAKGTGLFERVAAFFAFELKTNDKVQSLFQNQLLVQINQQLKGLEQQPLALGELESGLKDIAEGLPQVLTRLDNLEIALQDMGSNILEVGWLTASKMDVLMEIAADQTDDLAQIKYLLAKLVANGPQRYGDAPTLVETTNYCEREGPNPFTYGPAVLPERFYGRKGNLADIKSRIGGIEPQSINIVGLRRNGKSSILRYVKARIHEFCTPEQKPLLVLLDLQDRRFHQPAGILEGIRRGIKQQVEAEPWQKENNDAPFEVEDGLETLRDQGYRLIVMFDEFEAIGRRLEVFQDWGDDWRAKASASLITLVIASKQEVSKLYRSLNLTSPFGNIFSTTVLGALESEAWQQLLKAGDLSDPEQQWVYERAGGLPYYTQLAAAMLWQHGAWEQASQGFVREAQPRFEELWQGLTQREQLVLKQGRASVVLQGNPGIGEALKLHGLLQPNGESFSGAFADFVRQQR